MKIPKDGWNKCISSQLTTQPMYLKRHINVLQSNKQWTRKMYVSCHFPHKASTDYIQIYRERNERHGDTETSSAFWFTKHNGLARPRTRRVKITQTHCVGCSHFPQQWKRVEFILLLLIHFAICLAEHTDHHPRYYLKIKIGNDISFPCVSHTYWQLKCTWHSRILT